jgi:hypothetical protein
MAYESEKDKVLKQWESETTGLLVSINQYDNGEPKVQIGPRLYTKKDGTKGQGKAGRLSLEDLMWFFEIIDEVKETLSAMVRPR